MLKINKDYNPNKEVKNIKSVINLNEADVGGINKIEYYNKQLIIEYSNGQREMLGKNEEFSYDVKTRQCTFTRLEDQEFEDMWYDYII